MRILLASSEVHPYSKTGGLADMVGALGKALAHAGHEVGIITPLYLGIRERFHELKRNELEAELPLGIRRIRAEIWTLDPMPNLRVHFVDVPEFYQRPELYQKQGIDYCDNAERFIFFAKAVAHVALNMPLTEVVHLHDWQAGFAALFLHREREAGNNATPRTCMTIHNLAYQGLFPASRYALTNLPWNYFTPEGVEFYGQMSCLKAGIAFADVITTVSPRYAREIPTQEFGCGFDGLLRHRQGSLFGILNGVDYDDWNPANDPYLTHPYSATDLSGKTANKLDLQKELGLPQDAAIPLFGNIGRLVEQKGVEVMLGALEEMLTANIQFIQLGSGEAAFEKAYLELAKRFPSLMAVRIGFDEGLSHRVEAGCDFFVMPSRFEPCGLNQMYSLHYGTVPIVRATGGLDDTVIDIRENAGLADGIKFDSYSSQALAKAFRKALALYQEPELFQRFRINGMAKDFSWVRTAEKFGTVYRSAVGVSEGGAAVRAPIG
jgi:starch synthase